MKTTAWGPAARFVEDLLGSGRFTFTREQAHTLLAGPLLDCVRRHGEPVVAQRLGFLLDQTGHSRLTGGLAKWISGAPVRALDPGSPVSRSSMDGKWHLYVNATLSFEA